MAQKLGAPVALGEDLGSFPALCGDSQWSVITVPEEQMKRKLTLKWVSVTNVLSEEPHLIPTARTDGQCN